MNVTMHMYRLGGVCRRAQLLAVAPRAEVDAAVARGEIIRDGRGRYSLPVADEAVRAANALSGVVSHRTAALLHGWEVKTVPAQPDITVPRNRKLSDGRRRSAALHRRDLTPGQVDGWLTTREVTLVDCMRTLPFDEALAIADSALRHRAVTKGQLRRLAEQVRGPGAPQCRRVAEEASGEAANPFESVLRAISLDVDGLALRPQRPVDNGAVVHPDLVDVRRRIVVEADSFAWHGDRAALRRDCRRYTDLVVRGWRVLRFAWEDVMHEPDYVRASLRMIAAS